MSTKTSHEHIETDTKLLFENKPMSVGRIEKINPKIWRNCLSTVCPRFLEIKFISNCRNYEMTYHVFCGCIVKLLRYNDRFTKPMHIAARALEIWIFVYKPLQRRLLIRQPFIRFAQMFSRFRCFGSLQYARPVATNMQNVCAFHQKEQSWILDGPKKINFNEEIARFPE